VRQNESALIRQAVARFVLQLVVGFVSAVVLAALWALAHGGAYMHSLQLGLYIFGVLALLFGALGVGGMSPSRGLVQTSGRLPGVPALMRTPPGTTEVNATAIFFLTGATLITVAVFV
jgi:hypothetical protein